MKTITAKQWREKCEIAWMQGERLATALKNLIGKIEEMHGCMEVNYAKGHEECYPEFGKAREELKQWEVSQ